jgi:hypothetical protein
MIQGGGRASERLMSAFGGIAEVQALAEVAPKSTNKTKNARTMLISTFMLI